MRCPKCNHTISKSDAFCRFCGERVVAPPPEPRQPPAPDKIRIPIEDNDFGPAQILAPVESQTGAGWGAHIYTGSSKDASEVKTCPDGCPDWVQSEDWPRWFRRGLVVWDGAGHGVGTLLAGEAIELLDKLRANDDWKADGVPIIERHENWLMLDQPTRRKRGGKKKNAEPEPPPEESQPKSRHYEQERLRLRDEPAQEFFAYLRANEDQLRRMADEEAHLRRAFQAGALKIWLRIAHEHELSEFDAKTWTFNWIRRDDAQAIVADVPPDRATIALDDEHFCWRPVIERPGRSKWGEWERFIKLDDAIRWAEEELPRLHAQDEELDRQWEREEAEDLARVAALPVMDLAPFRISASELEPAHVTYRLFIELECVPYKSEREEISFGEFRHSKKQFYRPARLASELDLNPAQVSVEQLGDRYGLYRVYSAVTYHDAPLAAAQAQAVWDHSSIGARFAENAIVRARYGYQEIETEYCVWLGQLERPNSPRPWSLPETRTEYMQNLALDETLLRAMDLNGYRKHHKLRFKYLTDDDLQEAMHYQRADSPYQLADAKAESERWLQSHSKKIAG
jgi:hypothetical protein